MISQAYAAQNRQLHANPDYGISGQKYVAIVHDLIAMYGTRDILDYGCGKRTLQDALGFAIANYDPCVEGFDSPPIPHCIVVCNDVLEHVEPEHLTAVLKDIRRCTINAAFVTIDQRPASKTLPDGRNAHLIQQNAKWWLPRLWDAGFSIRGMQDSGNRIKATMV